MKRKTGAGEGMEGGKRVHEVSSVDRPRKPPHSRHRCGRIPIRCVSPEGRERFSCHTAPSLRNPGDCRSRKVRRRGVSIGDENNNKHKSVHGRGGSNRYVMSGSLESEELRSVLAEVEVPDGAPRAKGGGGFNERRNRHSPQKKLTAGVLFNPQRMTSLPPVQSSVGYPCTSLGPLQPPASQRSRARQRKFRFCLSKPALSVPNPGLQQPGNNDRHRPVRDLAPVDVRFAGIAKLDFVVKQSREGVMDPKKSRLCQSKGDAMLMVASKRRILFSLLPLLQYMLSRRW
ncbi:hypothetical protein BJ322DRAFT_835901 [Thelephora terrestris]|uniref:Uncharacterized protein n=1 Tax=Thelephora terrestris TaxID=56493 RepID=A0A9P6L7G9_9AGAM|nr:hypothetical protein BJ322DRAFT_835901 [Thelephora terrestris]